MANAPATPLHFGLSPWGNGMEFAPLGVLGSTFLAMAVPVRDPSSLDRAVLNREVSRDAVSQIFQDTIAAVWVHTSIRAAPSAGSCSWNRAVHWTSTLSARPATQYTTGICPINEMTNLGNAEPPAF